MARYPGAKWRPISRNFTKRNTAKDCALLHSTASASATSMFSWFSQKNANASSHFHVDDDGVVEQYIDTAHMSWANAAANPRSVTIETQGDGTKPWTPAQVVAIVALLVWICKTHDITIRQMASSLKSEKGVGWHRLGCDGNFPALPSILAGRGQRGKGESWSSARGKVCPGDDRIKQIPGIIAQVKGGDVQPVATVKPTATKPAPAKPAPKPAASGGSVVDWLNSKGRASSFAARAKLAAQYGIGGYKGTATQNVSLLAKLKAGAPAAASKPAPKKKVTGSVVDYLKARGRNSNYSARAKLAAQHGIKNYTGTAAQNTALLSKIQD